MHSHCRWEQDDGYQLVVRCMVVDLEQHTGETDTLRMAKAPLAEPVSAFEFEMHWQIATDCGKIEQNYVCLDCDPLVPFVQLTLQDLPPTLTTFAVRLPTCETYCKLAQPDCTQNCLLPRSHASDVQQLTCKRLS